MTDQDVLDFGRIRDLLKGFATSGLGRSVAGEMVPYWDVDRARRALEETQELMALQAEGTTPSTRGFRDIRPHLDHVREYGRPLEPEELMEVKEMLEAGGRLKAFFEGNAGAACPRLRTLTGVIGDFSFLLERLERDLDPKLGVRDEASAALARVRGRLKTVEAYLRNKAEELARSEKYRSMLTQTRPVLRGGHYLLAVKADFMRRVEGILHDRSNTGMTAFIEPRELVSYGNECKDLKVREAREVQRILWELSRVVMAEQEAILATLRRVAWFDFTLAKARMALAFDMHPPRLGGRELVLKKAYHPLLLLKTGRHAPIPHLKAAEPEDHIEVVPLTVRLGRDYDLLIITGPNTGGKTVALKTIGILTLMASSGVPVPAAPDSVIPGYTGVLADIGDEQSIEQSLSTFSSHIKRIIEILGSSGPDVLVLLDEVGAGTDPDEGAALGRAILARLLHKRVPGIITTHLGDLKVFAYEFPRVENACVEFDPKTLSPTYHLRLGQPGNSNALIIADRLGMDEDILEEARKSLDRKNRPAEDVIARMQASRVETERRLEASEDIMAEARRIKAESDAEAHTVERRRGELQAFSDVEMEKHLKRVRENLYPILSRMKNLPKPFASEVAALSEALDRSLQFTPLGERREQFIRHLKKDHSLYLPRLGVRGRVVRIDRKRRLIGVIAGDLRLDVPFEEVLPED